jgi:hypothetical protein
MVFNPLDPLSTDPVGDVLQHIMNVTVMTLQTAGRVVPERRYIAAATPVVDCEQLVVSWFSLQRGLPRVMGAVGEGVILEGKNCTIPRTVDTLVSLSRCWPSGTGVRPPDDTDIQQATHGTTIDGWLLYEACMASDSWGLGSVIKVTVTEPQGGYVTVTAAMTLAVP